MARHEDKNMRKGDVVFYDPEYATKIGYKVDSWSSGCQDSKCLVGEKAVTPV